MQTILEFLNKQTKKKYVILADTNFVYVCVCVHINRCTYVRLPRGKKRSLSVLLFHSLPIPLRQEYPLPEPWAPVFTAWLEVNKPQWSFCLCLQQSWAYRHTQHTQPMSRMLGSTFQTSRWHRKPFSHWAFSPVPVLSEFNYFSSLMINIINLVW